MDKVLSFFQVFDLALFLPGAVIYWIFHIHSLLPDLDPIPMKNSINLGTGDGLLKLIMTIGLMYGIGLSIHALQRLLQWFIRRKSRQSWYQKLEAGPRAELASYFWYMRATCWNLALSLSIAIVTLAVIGRLNVLGLLVLSVLSVLLLYLGRDFEQALHRIMDCV